MMKRTEVFSRPSVVDITIAVVRRTARVKGVCTSRKPRKPRKLKLRPGQRDRRILAPASVKEGSRLRDCPGRC